MPVSSLAAAARRYVNSPARRFVRTTRGTMMAGASAGALALAPGLPGINPLAPPDAAFSQDPNTIVEVDVSTLLAPAPIEYQQTGCFVTFGGTGWAPQTTQMFQNYEDLIAVVEQPVNITSVSYQSGIGNGTANVVLPAGNKLLSGWTPSVGDVLTLCINGVTTGSPATTANAFNNRWICTVDTIGAMGEITGFHYSNVGTTAPTPNAGTGNAQYGQAVELTQMAATFFGQTNPSGVNISNGPRAIWVLELGYDPIVANNAAALGTWLGNNPRSFYGYLLPRKASSGLSNVNSFLSAINELTNSPNGMTYFWFTLPSIGVAWIPATQKNCIKFVEAPAVLAPPNINTAGAEFSAASMFFNAMKFAPSEIQRVSPMAFKYVYGNVTPYPPRNNATLLQSFSDNNVNYIGSGSEGGITYGMIYPGVTADGFDYFNWWFTIDWVAIHAHQDMANAIINGSNNPLAPLYYNQDGVDYLEGVLYGTMLSASTFGMVLGPLVMTRYNQPTLETNIYNGSFAASCDVNAIPFIDYVTASPDDYGTGTYKGFSVLFIPSRGFMHVYISIVATDLVSL
jgi:hypothetical protein